MKTHVVSSCLRSAVLLLIIGCTQTTPIANPTPQLTTEPLFPSGNFTNGDFAWEFKPDGTFSNSGPLGSETGTWIVNGMEVVFTCRCCGDIQGNYSWMYTGNTLTFKVLEDACTNRKDVVDGSTWTRMP